MQTYHSAVAGNLTFINQAPHPFLGKQVWFDAMIETSDIFFKQHIKQ